jgi:hypothetical protein
METAMQFLATLLIAGAFFYLLFAIARPERF